MSKVQEKDANLLNNLSGSEIANELDSRLRDLEKNIAVAREFIKLADESYSELRHKWNLLHEEVRSKPQTQQTERTTITEEKTETRDRKRKRFSTKSNQVATLDEPENPYSTDISPKLENHSKRVKAPNRSTKEKEIVNKDTASPDQEKPSQLYRDPGRRHGKARRN
ncbi:MAG TPA: hypothetical protein VNA15_06420 [Candidatus Angelobacter sp.]|nr:hypothetical protein [Candidatus Angelobacter sp.]